MLGNFSRSVGSTARARAGFSLVEMMGVLVILALGSGYTLTTQGSLAFLSPVYLLQQLQDFKSGQRRNPMMDAVVVNLQAADLKTLAAHFHAQTRSQLPSPAARPPGAAVHPAVASCTACHDNAALPGTPDLVGQQQPYLAQQLRAYRAGTRKNAIMEPLAKGLSDADITALAAYYSTLAPAAPARSR